METVIEFIKAFTPLAWPLLVLFIVIFFRGQLRCAIDTLSNKLGELSRAEFEKIRLTFKTLGQEAEKLTTEPKQLTQEQVTAKNKRIAELYRIAEVTPLDAIIDGWKEIEKRLTEIAEFKQYAEPYRFRSNITLLEHDGIIPPDKVALIHDLHNLCNKAMQHQQIFNLDSTKKLVDGYLSSVTKVNEYLLSLKNTLEAKHD